jgi:acyl-CoA thioesterase-1
MDSIPADDLRHPAYFQVIDRPGFPSVLLIGDSISIGYTITVREILDGKANVHRIPENGRDTENGLNRIDAWLGNQSWDLIHFNFGLHDIKRVRDGKMDVSGIRVLSASDYERNLTRILDHLKPTGARLIFATTTPVPDGADGRLPGDEIECNAIAGSIMAQAGVSINDLHAFVTPHLTQVQTPRNVHFTETGSQLLGEEVARVILAALRPNTNL